jgi:DNA-binding PadR family transcriptional regulator
MEDEPVKDLEVKLTAELRRGVLQIAVLALMREPSYGYQLGKDLAGHGLETEEGTLYPILRRLEQQGLCESSWDTGGNRPRKYYRTTDKGRATLDNLLVTFRRIGVALEAVLDAEPGGKKAGSEDDD